MNTQKNTILTNYKEEKDFIVVKDTETAEALLRKPIPSLKGKYIIVAPDGLEMVSMEDLKQLPQVKKYLDEYTNRLKEEQITLTVEEYMLFEHMRRAWLVQTTEDTNQKWFVLCNSLSRKLKILLGGSE